MADDIRRCWVELPAIFFAAPSGRLASLISLCHECHMIEFRQLPDDHPDLARSPMLRAALLTLKYAQQHGSIGLSKTKAFKRVFVHWAVEHFGWPSKSAEEMFRYNKVINECEFPPLEVLHYLLISLRLGRHVKGEFRLTNRGAELVQAPGSLFAVLIPHFVRGSSSRAPKDRPCGNQRSFLR